MLLNRRGLTLSLAATLASSLLLDVPGRTQTPTLFLKLNWNTIFAGVSAALAAITVFSNWLTSGNSKAEENICKLSSTDIGVLQYRCFTVALALDANADGPVIPPQKGDIGIIPALDAFVKHPTSNTFLTARFACGSMLDASNNLIMEISEQPWKSIIKDAGLTPEKVTIFMQYVKMMRPEIYEFWFLSSERQHKIGLNQPEAADLSKQLEGMPLAADRALSALHSMDDRWFDKCFLKR